MAKIRIRLGHNFEDSVDYGTSVWNHVGEPPGRTPGYSVKSVKRVTTRINHTISYCSPMSVSKLRCPRVEFIVVSFDFSACLNAFGTKICLFPVSQFDSQEFFPYIFVSQVL